MANIAEHDTKQEREDGNGVQGWVDFLISGNTVCVDDLLEWRCESVRFNVCWTFGLCLHLSQGDERWKNLIQKAGLLLFDPNLANHDIVSFLQQVHRVENKRLFFKEHSEGFESRTPKVLGLNSTFETFFETFLTHGPEMFGIGNVVFDILDLIENFILVGGQPVFFSTESIANPVDFVDQSVSRFDNYDESGTGNRICIGL